MESNQSLKIVLIIFLSFVTYYFLFTYFQTIKLGLDNITQQGLISYILTYFIIGIPIFLGTYFINKTSNVFKSLGLLSDIPIALLTSLIFVFPMFLGGLLFFKFDRPSNIENLFADTFVAGFMEELYFRGFLFGQLYRKANLGFLPSIFFGALIFAVGHSYQSQDIGELTGIFMVTFSGAILYAWLYVEWNFNLWVPIFTHTLMNLTWNIFQVDNSALGDTKANIFRGITILVAIIFTVLYKKNRNEKLLINGRTLVLKRKKDIY